MRGTRWPTTLVEAPSRLSRVCLFLMITSTYIAFKRTPTESNSRRSVRSVPRPRPERLILKMTHSSRPAPLRPGCLREMNCPPSDGWVPFLVGSENPLASPVPASSEAPKRTVTSLMHGSLVDESRAGPIHPPTVSKRSERVRF